MNIGVLAASSSWHFQDLQRSTAQRHQIISVSFDDLWTALGEGKSTYGGGGVELQKLDRLIVRTMPRGSLQQIIFRMNLLDRLARSGLRIVNAPRTIEVAVDKYLSLSMLAQAGIAIPPTGVAESVRAALKRFA